MKNHHPARKEALTMMTPWEITHHVPPFESAAWKKRKKETADEIKKAREENRLEKERYLKEKNEKN